jgi:hypothetical protein
MNCSQYRIHVECGRPNSDRGTLRHNWSYVGRRIGVHSEVNFSAKVEQIFFGVLLIPIAGFYLGFTAYFGDKDAWQLEATAVAVFARFGLVKGRVPFALIIGYVLHGLWDAVQSSTLLAGLYWALARPHRSH